MVRVAALVALSVPLVACGSVSPIGLSRASCPEVSTLSGPNRLVIDFPT
jgi:hypothetical protein